MARYFFILFSIVIAADGSGQGNTENIPGGIPKGQSWWNLLHYDIDLKPDYDSLSRV